MTSKIKQPEKLSQHDREMIAQLPEGWHILTDEERKRLPLRKATRDLSEFDGVVWLNNFHLCGDHKSNSYAVKLDSETQKEVWPHLTQPEPAIPTDEQLRQMEVALMKMWMYKYAEHIGDALDRQDRLRREAAEEYSKIVQANNGQPT